MPFHYFFLLLLEGMLGAEADQQGCKQGSEFPYACILQNYMPGIMWSFCLHVLKRNFIVFCQSFSQFSVFLFNYSFTGEAIILNNFFEGFSFQKHWHFLLKYCELLCKFFLMYHKFLFGIEKVFFEKVYVFWIILSLVLFWCFLFKKGDNLLLCYFLNI